MKKIIETIFGFLLVILLVGVLGYFGTSIYNASIGTMTGHGIYFNQMVGIMVLLWMAGAILSHSFATVFLSKITTLVNDLLTLTKPPVSTNQITDNDSTNNNP